MNKPRPIKRERIKCKTCGNEIIKETWNHGGVYYLSDFGFALTSHNCKVIEEVKP